MRIYASGAMTCSSTPAYRHLRRGLLTPNWCHHGVAYSHFACRTLELAQTATQLGFPHLGEVLIQGGIKRWEAQQALSSMLCQLQRLKTLQGSRMPLPDLLQRCIAAIMSTLGRWHQAGHIYHGQLIKRSSLFSLHLLDSTLGHPVSCTTCTMTDFGTHTERRKSRTVHVQVPTAGPTSYTTSSSISASAPALSADPGTVPSANAADSSSAGPFASCFCFGRLLPPA